MKSRYFDLKDFKTRIKSMHFETMIGGVIAAVADTKLKKKEKILVV